MSTWPSADLWVRMVEGTLLDETPCPACGCPAATHYRDVQTQAFKCPPGGDPVKLMEMVRRAPRVPNAGFLGARAPTPNELKRSASMAGAADRELEEWVAANPAMAPLLPQIKLYAAQDPTATLAQIARRAREYLAARDQLVIDRLAEVTRVAKDLTGTTGLDAAPASWRNPATGGEIRGRISGTPTPGKRPPAPNTKRRFALDEDE